MQYFIWVEKFYISFFHLIKKAKETILPSQKFVGSQKINVTSDGLRPTTFSKRFCPLRHLIHWVVFKLQEF